MQQAEVNQLVAMAAVPMTTNTEIAAVIGRDQTTVGRARKRYEGLITQYRQLKSRDIIDDLDSIRRAHLMHVADPAIIQEMSGLQAATTYAILTDKMLLESGRPTSIHLGVQADVQVPDVLGRLKRVLEAHGHPNMRSDQQVDAQVVDSSDDASHESDK